MDHAQYGRSGGGLRPRAVLVARQGAARGKSAHAAAGASLFDPGGAVHSRGARAAVRRRGGRRMKPRPIAGIVLRQFYLLRGSPVRVFPMVTWVAIDIVLWGFCTRIMQGVTTAFLEDVWSRNFLNLFASPLSISEYIAGLVITSVLTSSIGVVVMLLLATGVFQLQFFTMGLPLIAFLLVLFVFGI